MAPSRRSPARRLLLAVAAAALATSPLARPALLDLTPLRVTARLQPPGHPVGSFADTAVEEQGGIAVDRGGARLLSFDLAGAVHVWDTRTGEARRVLRPALRGAHPVAAAFRDDRTARLTLASRETGAARAVLLDLASGAVRDAPPVPPGPCAGLRPDDVPASAMPTAACSPDARLKAFFVPAGQGVRVAVYDVATRRRTLAVGHPDHVVERGVSLSFSPSSRRLAAEYEYRDVNSDNRARTVQIVDLPGGATPAVFEVGPDDTRLSWRPDGGALLVARTLDFRNDPAPQGEELRLYDVARGGAVWTIEARENARGGVFSPDGRTLYVVRADAFPEARDAATGRTVRRFGHPVAAFDVGAALAVTGGAAGRVRVWGRDGRERGGWDAHDEAVVDVALDPGGARLATASTDGTVRLWRPSGAPVRAWRVGPASGLAFSADGAFLSARVFAPRDPAGRLVVWRVADGAALKLPGEGSGALHFVGSGARVLREERRERAAAGRRIGEVRLSVLALPGGRPAWTGEWREEGGSWRTSADGRRLVRLTPEVRPEDPAADRTTAARLDVIDLATGRTLRTVRFASNARVVYSGPGLAGLSPDGGVALVAETAGDGCGAAFLGLRAFDLDAGRETRLPTALARGYDVQIGCGLGTAFPDFRFGADGRTLGVRAGNRVDLWTAADGARVFGGGPSAR